jgi:hypothetical protein
VASILSIRPPVHVHHLKTPAKRFHDLARLWQVVQFADHKPGDRLIVAIGRQDDPELVGYLVGRH